MSDNNDNNSNIFNILLSTKAWKEFFFKTPCVKSSYLWGIGCGAIMFAHKSRLYKGNLYHAFNAAFLTFGITSSASFMFCTTEYNNRHQAIRDAFLKKGINYDDNKNKNNNNNNNIENTYKR